jgi:dipeptidyl aminopeptidase/acylaminoacyl peptidase
MTPTTQPAGGRILEVRESPDGRHVAFVSANDRSSQIVVVDRQTKAESIVPSPNERIYESRQIRRLEWDESGQMLYVVEDATEGVTNTAEWKALSPNERSAQLAEKNYSVLYSWKPGDTEVRVLDRVNGRFVTLAAGTRGARLITQSKEKGWGFIDLREYRDGERRSLRTFHVAINGQAIELGSAQLLSKRNELWFITDKKQSDRTPPQPWLAMMDLNNPDAGAHLILRDVRRFAWSPDEERIVALSMGVDERDNMKDDNGQPKCKTSFLVMRRGALDRPVVLASRDLGDNLVPSLAGFRHDGRTLYFIAAAKPVVRTDDLSDPGATRVYELQLPN